MRGGNAVADMAGIAFDVGTGANPQIDSTDFLARISVDHLEEMGRDAMHRVRRDLDRFQDQFAVP
jgi:hypothetical protein